MFFSFLKFPLSWGELGDEKFKNRITEQKLAIIFHLIPFIHLNGCRTATIVLRLETDYFSMVVIRKRPKIRREIGCESANAALVQVSWFGQFRNCVCMSIPELKGFSQSLLKQLSYAEWDKPCRKIKVSL
jgi:hypothetical protein